MAGVHEHQRVPVVGRGNHHRVHVFVFQELLIFRVLLRSRPALRSRKIHVVVPQIAHRDCLLVSMLQKGVVDLIASIAKPDIAHADTLIGAQNA
jgi:hypothetical protein